MRVVVAGLGVQGTKRCRVAGSAVVATVDPVAPDAAFKRIQDVPLGSYDAVLACIPDEPKVEALSYLLAHGKHVLVEKPLLGSDAALRHLQSLAGASRAVCYVAYNHRFEPHFVRMKRLLESGALGRIYTVRLFYGNGTARLVRESGWRDRAAGVLPDLGSHLLDTLLYWFGSLDAPFEIRAVNRFENAAPDHVIVGANGRMAIELEMTLLSWRNHFAAEIIGEHGSAHIDSLCKWGPSTFTHRRRVLPSGRPPEETATLVQDDPTWALEYEHFVALCGARGPSEFDKEVWLSRELNRLSADAIRRAA